MFSCFSLVLMLLCGTYKSIAMPQLCSIFKSIKFVYIASKLFAVLPYSISSGDGLKINSCRYSLWLTIVSAGVTTFSIVTFPLYIFVMEGSCFWCMLFSDDSNRTAFPDLPKSKYQVIAVKIVNRYLVSAMSGATLLFAFHHSKTLPLLLSKLNETDKYFRVLLKHSMPKVECCISLWIIGGMMLVSIPTLGYYMFVELKRPNVSLTTIFVILVFVWESFNSTICEAQFVNLAYLLQVRFRIINNYLSDLQKSTPCKIGRNFERGSIPTRKKYRSINHRVAPFLSENCFQSLPPSSKLLSIELSRRCHRYLCEMITDLNGTYQLVFLVTFTGCFLRVLYCMFSIIVVLTDQLASSLFEDTLKRVFFLIFYASRFFTIILSAHQTVEEGVHTRVVVAELSSSNEDEETKKELKLFYNQVKNRRLEFSACSLFTLNPGIILSAVAVGTTYLVILIQFQAPSD